MKPPPGSAGSSPVGRAEHRSSDRSVAARDAACFLYYGFTPLPLSPEDVAFWSRPAAREAGEAGDVNAPEEELVDRGVEILREVCGAPAGDLHVVPLSGGGDSRLLLALLLEAGLRDRLVAVTFGSPGTLDFELGRRVARRAGVRHEEIDLTRVPIDQAGLEACIARHPGMSTAWDDYFNELIPARFGPDAVYWSGYMANTINGVHSSVVLPGWEQARARFAARNRMARSADLRHPEFDPVRVLPEAPLFPGSVWNDYEQLFIGVKYHSRLRQVLLTPGYDIRTPFCDPRWVGFVATLPLPLRREEDLARRVMLRAAPDLFALPVKGKLGLPLDASRGRYTWARVRSRASRLLRERFPGFAQKPAAKTNYIDFDVELRRNQALRDLVRDNLDRLGARGLADWVDIESLWSAHERCEANHGRALSMLASLEMNARVRERAVAP